MIRALATSVALVVSACAPAIPPCGPATCEGGCCDSRGLCVAGRTKRICGLGGNACVACDGADLCIEGACIAPRADGGLDAGVDAGTEPDAGRRRTVLVRRTDETWTPDGGIASLDVDLNAIPNQRLLYEDPETGGFISVDAAPQSGPVLRFEDVPEGPYLVQRSGEYIASDADSLELGTRVIGRRSPSASGATLNVTLSAQSPAFRTGDVVQAHSFGSGLIAEAFRTLSTDGGTLSSTATLATQVQAYGLRSDSDELTVTLRRSFVDGGVAWSSTVLAGTIAAPELGVGQTAAVSVALTPVAQQRWPLELRTSGFEQFARDVHPAATTNITQAFLFAVPALSRSSSGGDFDGRSVTLAQVNISAGRPDVRQEITVGNPVPDSTLLAQGRLFVQVPNSLTGRTITRSIEAMVTTVGDGGVLDVTLSPPRFVRINGEAADVNRSGVSVSPVFEWSPPALGTPTGYVVLISKLTPQGTTFSETFVLRLRTPFTRIKVPGEILEAGAPYVAVIGAVASPGFDNRRFPFHLALESSRSSAVTGIFVP